jgi:hypothetical protein
MFLVEAEAFDRIFFEVKLDQHGCFLAHNPGFVTRFDDDNLRRDEIHCAAIVKRKPEMAARQESNVRVHAEFGIDYGLDVGGPAKARRINHALNTAKACRNYVQLHAADFAVIGSGQRGKKRIISHKAPPV